MGRLSRYFLLSVLPGRRKAWHGHAQSVNMMYSFLYWILKGNKQATGHNQHSLLLQFCHNEKALREGVFEENFQFKHHFKSKISSLRLNLFSFHGVGHKNETNEYVRNCEAHGSLFWEIYACDQS